MQTPNKDNYFVFHPFTAMKNFYEDPLIFSNGHGSLITDVHHRTFINSISGLWNLCLGLGNQEIIQAITEQLTSLSYASLFRMGHDIASVYARELVRVLPGELRRIFFTSNGSEAVETMIKIARQYQKLRGKEGKYRIICFKRAYHGVSYGALSASGFEEDQEMFSPLLPGFIHTDPPYCLRCAFHQKVDSCRVECVKQIEELIKRHGEETISGLMFEPILGFGGFIVPPDKFYRELQKLLSKYDILLMLDEVTTGFGRTGKLFACEHWGLRPDMISLGKAMGGGYMPLGAAAFSDKIFNEFLNAGARFNHGSTFSGHPASCAAGRKVLEIYLRDKIVDRVRELEEELFARFHQLQELSCVAEVRGKGAMLAIEFVKDRKKLEPLDAETMYKLVREILQWGVLVHLSGNCIFLLPPLNMDLKYLKKIHNTIVKSIKEVLNIGIIAV